MYFVHTISFFCIHSQSICNSLKYFFFVKIATFFFKCFHTKVGFFQERKVFKCWSCDTCYGISCLYFTLWISQLKQKIDRFALKEVFDKNPALPLPLSSVLSNERPFSSLKFKENSCERADSWFFLLISIRRERTANQGDDPQRAMQLRGKSDFVSPGVMYVIVKA